MKKKVRKYCPVSGQSIVRKVNLNLHTVYTSV